MLLISIVLLTGQICYSKSKKDVLTGKVIVIDPGHGGKDAGTSVGDVLEKNFR